MAAGVKQLVDVREAPVSRKRGFSKVALAQALQEAGITYRHLQALGCPRHIRDRFHEDEDWDQYTRDFMQHLGNQLPAIEELRALVVSHPTAVLCFEADFHRCHRTYVAQAVARQTGARICHITATGLIEEAGAAAA